MDTSPTDPADAERRFAALLEDAGLPPYDSVVHDAALQELRFTWHEQRLTIHLDLTRDDMSPIDDWERASILGNDFACCGLEPIHVTVPGSAEDPRDERSIPGVVIHRVPELHPDDVTTLDGIPITTPSRTLIDMAEVLSADVLRECFARARARGLLDPDALRAARARVEWRPSLEMLDEVIAEFCG